MGKVIIGFTMSLDGFINDQNGSVERLYPDLDTLRYAKPFQESIEKTGEYHWAGNDIRWKLEAFGGGTRLTLWHNIDRGFISIGAAGWHICFDVLDHLLSGTPIGRIVGPEAMKFGWQRLNAEYAKQFGIETLNWPPQAAQKS